MFKCWVAVIISQDLETPKDQATMRAPSLLAQCLPGLVAHDKGSHSMSSISERDVHLCSPAVEILPSKVLLQPPFKKKNMKHLYHIISPL